MLIRLPEQNLANQFLLTGSHMLRPNNRDISEVSRARRFRENFKWGPGRLAYLYTLIKDLQVLRGLVHDHYQPKHLLWTFYFLCSYATERRMCIVLGADRKSIRKITWPTIIAIASLAPNFVSLSGYMRFWVRVNQTDIRCIVFSFPRFALRTGKLGQIPMLVVIYRWIVQITPQLTGCRSTANVSRTSSMDLD